MPAGAGGGGPADPDEYFFHSLVAAAIIRAMETIEIEPGTIVQVRNAYGDLVEMMATSGLTAGRDFAVVWVQQGDDEPIPWPADAVLGAVGGAESRGGAGAFPVGAGAVR